MAQQQQQQQASNPADVQKLKNEITEANTIIKELRRKEEELDKIIHEHHEVRKAKAPEVFIQQAQPYAWPYDGKLHKHNTALIVIDMQVDFCAKGGYVDKMGYDVAVMRKPIEPIQQVLKAVREKGILVIHTREGHRPDLSDLPANKFWRSKKIGAAIGEKGPCGRILVRGEPGWDIIPELKPEPNEIIVDKPGKGAFYATDLELLLRTKGVRNLVLTGVTTDVCVHTTLREGNDRGFECIVLEDCTAATDFGDYLFALKMVKMSGGIFGAVCHSENFISAIANL